MKLGIFAKTFGGQTPAVALASARRAGYLAVQYNMACSGLAALPETITPEIAEAVAAAARETATSVAAISATYNMIDPDRARRERGRRAFAAIAGAAQRIGVGLITVCTGSRDPDDQWRAHRDNASAQAWRDLLGEFAQILPIAERCDVSIGVEPELANVVAGASEARALIDQLNCERIRIVLDPANLFERASDAERKARIERAVDLLGDAIALAHAKDRAPDGGVAAAGDGVIDFAHFFRALRRAGFEGTVITHGLAPADAARVAVFLGEAMRRAEAPA